MPVWSGNTKHSILIYMLAKWLRSLTAAGRKTRVQSPAAPSLGVRQATADRGFSVAVSSGCQHSKARKSWPHDLVGLTARKLTLDCLQMIELGKKCCKEGTDSIGLRLARIGGRVGDRASAVWTSLGEMKCINKTQPTRTLPLPVNTNICTLLLSIFHPSS